MSTWYIELTPANHHQLNDVLALRKTNQKQPFRHWFGGLAGEIFDRINSGLKLSLNPNHVLDKTQAQHILIEAAMVHQHCMYHYRIHSDLKPRDTDDLALRDLLLFIRMANYHPNEQDLIHYQQHSHVIESCDHLFSLINQLQKQQLIQKITVGSSTFYDKNPYPHCHLLDTETGRISDYDCHLNTLHNKRFLRIPHAGIECA